MLLIGDLHINARYHEKILTQLKDIFSSYPDEKNIIFLWDYVYHFAYDRNALLKLYGLFLELFEQGKNIYIISGNHDRLGNSFVFEEAKKAFEVMINNLSSNEGKWEMINWIGKIKFITKPLLQTIEWEEILFMPFFLPWENEELNYIPKNEKLKSISDFAVLLEKSNNKHEIFSWYINKYLAKQIDVHPWITIIHHYYFNNTAFPGQKSKFNYKDIALNEQFLELSEVKFISGHLHQGFTHTNYLCTGSVRSTSSLETNQNKYIFHYNTKTQHITGIPITINPQFLIQNKEILTKDLLLEEIGKINQMNKGYFQSPSRNITFTQEQKIMLENITLTLQVDQIDYDKIEEVVDVDLRKSCKDLRLKKSTENLDELLSSFKVDSSQLAWFSDRKSILTEYMQKKFGSDYPKYEKILKELKLL